MDSVTVNLSQHNYRILIGDGLLSGVPSAELITTIRGRTCAIVTDSNVFPLCGAALTETVKQAGAAGCATSVFPAGEASKTLTTLTGLYRFGVTEGLGRDSVILALGGGVVGDVAGLFAATFLRGLTYVQVPTTLLALVDSSVGGKVAVDLPEGKNLVGAFHQPSLVLADLSFLATLPPRELRSGLAEVIKYGMILDAELFCLLEAHTPQLLTTDRPLLQDVVARCCRLKADIVQKDEKELGPRAILNYGHTFGHALEALGAYSLLTHGEAVAVGMGMAADLAAGLGMFPGELARRQERLIAACGLPTRLAGQTALSPAAVLDAMYRDKKVRAGKLRLVLPTAIGSVIVTECADRERLLAAIGGRLG